MAYDAKLGSLSYEEKPIIDKTHSPILLGVGFPTGQGELKRGLLVAVVTATPDEYVPYNPAGDDGTQNVKGVLTSTIDTTDAATVGTIIVHGTVVEENLHVNNSALDAADMAALRAMTIYPL